MAIVNKIYTRNWNFNNAFEMLATFFKVTLNLPNLITIDVSKPMRTPSKSDLPKLAEAIADYVDIGRRNRWLKFHTDGSGREVYWCISDRYRHATPTPKNDKKQPTKQECE